MASALKKFGDKVTNDLKQLAKLFKEVTAGNRVLPSRTSKNDAEYRCRIDMVNSQAKSEGLKTGSEKTHKESSQRHRRTEMLRAENEREEEGKRVVEQLVEQAKKKI
ncbi:uncharacterized protein BDW70DRAFT_162725 [Aspergillus foveolatus]|uniref:uncharacterized protein n=1 Tax=Aspergillus foveolatus TaxID=210207 RepID=UPI003CCDC222